MTKATTARDRKRVQAVRDRLGGDGYRFTDHQILAAWRECEQFGGNTALLAAADLFATLDDQP